MTVHGLVIAAGAGSRMGRPKALVTDERGSWLRRSASALLDGGCDHVTVVLGAAADRARSLVDGLPVGIVVAEDWAAGMAASLRAGLDAVPETADAVVITLVDLPDVGAEVVRRVVALAGPAALARASYDTRPGHPVLVGRDHLAGFRATLTGDEGGRAYLATLDVISVECGDLATGRDRDTR